MNASAPAGFADDPCAFLYALAARAPGRTQRMRQGPLALVFIQGAAAAQQVLVDNAPGYHKHFASFMPLLGRSRLTADGAEWRRLQRLSQPFTTPRDRDRLAAVASRRYDALAEDLLQLGEGAIDPLLDRAALGTLSETTMSTAVEALGADFADDLRTVIRDCARRAWEVAENPAAEPSPARSAAERRLRQTIGRLAAERRAAAAPPADALTAITAAAAAAPGLDLAGELLTLVVAGADTTAAALGWALSILADNPDYQERLRFGIANALGDAPPTLAGAAAVPELDLFLEETLRMFPPVPILSRIAVAADRIGDEPIAVGDRVLVSVIGLHQDPATWVEPIRFAPDRHRQGRVAHLAFGAGSRMCGGPHFARIELSLALVAVLRRCRIAPAGVVPLAFEWGASMRRRGGHRLAVTPA